MRMRINRNLNKPIIVDKDFLPNPPSDLTEKDAH